MRAKLYVILGSHACRAGILMLEHKGIEYETHTFPTGLHPFAVRLRGFPGQTVPALKLDGEKVQTNPDIARFLDRLQPEPPLFPADPERRAEVEEAERFADDVFQMVARRLTFAGGVLRGEEGLNEGGDVGRLGPLLARSVAQRKRIGWVASRFRFDVNVDTERELLAEFPGQLDRIDRWVEAGVLNGEELNSADFQTAPSLALLCYRPDLRPDIESRPLGRLVDRLLPDPQASAAAA